MSVYDAATAPFDKPKSAGLDPSQVQFDDGTYAVEPSIVSETLKAPARVLGGIAQEAGEAAQYLTGDRVGRGIRGWGEGVQERNAQTPAFRDAHPILSTAGDVAEGVAKMAPYLAADVALSAVAPEAGLPAAAGIVARGIRAVKAAPFATTVLPTVAGAAQGQRSYEKGVANGLTPDEALAASTAPAAVTGVGLAAMGALSHGLQGVGGAAKTLKGQFAKHAAADTAIMMGQGVATSAAEKATGIDPNAKPLDQLKDPKAWLSAALTGGMFAGLGVAKKAVVARALKDHLESVQDDPAAFKDSAAQLAQAVHPEDAALQAVFQADMQDRAQAGEPLLNEQLVNDLTKEPTVKETRDSVLESLAKTVETGGEVSPLEALSASEEGKVLEALKVEAPQEAAAPVEDPALIRAKRWAEQGSVPVREGVAPDAEVAAHLDEMGYTLVAGERMDRTAGGNVARREWWVEKKPEEPAAGQHPDVESWKRSLTTEQLGEVAEYEDLRYKTVALQGPEKGYKPYKLTAAEKTRLGTLGEKYSHKYLTAEAQAALGKTSEEGSIGKPIDVTPAPVEPSTIKNGEQRLAYGEENPNMVVARKDDKIALIDAKNKEVLGLAHIKGDKFSGWVDGKEPEASERPQVERVLRGHLGEQRFNQAAGAGLPKADVETHLKDIIGKLKVPVKIVEKASDIKGLREDAPKFNGAFHNGTIYLNAEHLGSLKEAEHVLLKHELAHAGLRGALGSEGLDKVLAKAWGDLNSGVREFAKGTGIDTSTKAGKLEATEEYLVHLAETGAKHPLWDKFVAAFKAAMRKLGFEVKFSDAELRQLVVEATRSMKTEAGDTRFSATPKGETDGPVPHDISARPVAERLGILEDEYRSAGHDVPRGSFRESENVSLRGKLGKVAGLFGYDITVLADFHAAQPDGFVHPRDPKRIYISESVENPHLAVLGHELLHMMQRSNRPLYEELGQAIIGLRDEAGLEKYMRTVAPAEVEAGGSMSKATSEEWIADVVGRSMNSKEFWAEFEKAQPSLAARVAAFIHDMIVSVKQQFGRTGLAEQTVRDFNKVTKVTAEVMGRFADQRAAEAEALSKFSRVADKASPKDVDEVATRLSASVVKRALSDITGDVWRSIMPIDRTIKMAQSLKTYEPIKDHLDEYLRQKRAKAAAADVPPTHAQTIRLEHEKVFKTDAAHKLYDEVTTKATLYELHADGRDAGWTEKSWAEAGKLEQTGKSLGQARREVAELWGKLTPEQRAVQQKTIEHMKVLADQFREAQLEPLRATFGDEMFAAAEALSKDLWKADPKSLESVDPDTLQLAHRIAEINSDRGTLKGDYAPLMRFGNHVVRTLDAASEERLKTEIFESKQDALDAVERIKKEKGVVPSYEVQPEADKHVTNIPLAFLEKMKSAAESRGLSGEALEALMDDFKAARAQTLPRVSLAGNKLRREGVEGYSTDALRSYATYVSRSARAIASLKYGTKIEQSFRDMDNAIKAYQDPEGKWDAHAVERMSTLKDNLYRLEMKGNAERINEFTKTVGKATFLWYLSSPSVWAVQWSQPFMTTIPKMAARYGMTKAFASYVKEAKEYTLGKFSDEKIEAFNASHENAGERLYALIQQERTALPAERAGLRKSMRALYDGFSPADQKLLVLKVLGLQGMLDLSSSHSLQDLISGASDGQKLMDSVVNKGAFFMQKSETGSRRAAAVSSFQLALAHGKDFMEANDYAANIIDDTLADFSSQNRPGILRGNTGRVLGQFQFFRLHMLGKTIQLAKDAFAEEGWGEHRKELAYMTGMSMALAGAAGTPLAMLASNTFTNAVWEGLQMMFGDPDDPWDPKADFEQALRQAAGDTAANVFLKGAPTLMGVDVSRRIGMGGMAEVISGEPPPGLTGTQKAQWYAGRILGPAFGMVSDSMRALDAVNDGELGQAVAVSSPKVLKDFVKAYGLTEKGVVSGGRTVLQPDDVSPASVALMMVGINPAEVALAQEESRELSGLSTTLRQRRSLLIKRVAEATMAGDMEAREEALQGINEWGTKQPALRITQRELVAAVKRGRDAAAGRLSKRDQVIKGLMGQ